MLNMSIMRNEVCKIWFRMKRSVGFCFWILRKFLNDCVRKSLLPRARMKSLKRRDNDIKWWKKKLTRKFNTKDSSYRPTHTGKILWNLTYSLIKFHSHLLINKIGRTLIFYCVFLNNEHVCKKKLSEENIRYCVICGNIKFKLSKNEYLQKRKNFETVRLFTQHRLVYTCLFLVRYMQISETEPQSAMLRLFTLLRSCYVFASILI